MLKSELLSDLSGFVALIWKWKRETFVALFLNMNVVGDHRVH